MDEAGLRDQADLHGDAHGRRTPSAQASIDVTITVTDVDEAPEIMVGGLAISGKATVDDYAENGTGAVATYTASGPDAAIGYLVA